MPAEKQARLRRMDASEWGPWYAEASAAYVEDLVALGGLDRAAAQAKARQDESELLPEGALTPGHHFFFVEVSGRRVGSLWLAEDRDGAGPLVWVYDIHIEPTSRGQGLGRATMLLVEEEARMLGHQRTGLHVFDDNAPARALYSSLGYEVTETQERSAAMVKVL